MFYFWNKFLRAGPGSEATDDVASGENLIIIHSRPRPNLWITGQNQPIFRQNISGLGARPIPQA